MSAKADKKRALYAKIGGALLTGTAQHFGGVAFAAPAVAASYGLGYAYGGKKAGAAAVRGAAAGGISTALTEGVYSGWKAGNWRSGMATALGGSLDPVGLGKWAGPTKAAQDSKTNSNPYGIVTTLSDTQGSKTSEFSNIVTQMYQPSKPGAVAQANPVNSPTAAGNGFMMIPGGAEPGTEPRGGGSGGSTLMLLGVGALALMMIVKG